MKQAKIFVTALILGLCLMGFGYLAAENSADEPSVSFGVIADVQYCDCEPKGSRYYRASVQKLRTAVQQLNRTDIDFAIHLGDLIDRDFSSLDSVLLVYRQLKMPAYHVLGNHDFSVFPEKRHQVIRKMGLKKRYHDFSYDSWRFIVLDGNDLSLYAQEKGSKKYQEADSLYHLVRRKGRSNAKEWNGGLSKEQLQWLARTLQKASENDQKAVVFSHHPIFPPNAHNMWNDQRVLDLVTSYGNVAAMMSGHNHGGNYGTKNGVHFLTLKGLVETPKETAYSVVHVYEDRIEVEGFGREQDRVLKLNM